MSGMATFGDLGPTTTTPDQRAACRRFVTHHATDDNDARDLLAALGLEES